MAIDRSLRATILQLMMLEKSGADLAGELEEAGPAADAADSGTSQVDVAKNDTSIAVVASGSSGPAAPGSLGAGEGGPIPSAVAGPIRGPKAPNRAAPSAGEGGSSR